jgi:hypothetical protein
MARNRLSLKEEDGHKKAQEAQRVLWLSCAFCAISVLRQKTKGPAEAGPFAFVK